MAKCRFAITNQFKYLEQFPDYVFVFTGGTYFDRTEQARDPSAGDVIATGTSTNDAIYIGFKYLKFHHLRFIISAAASAGTRQWKYGTGVGTFSNFVNSPLFLRGDNDFKTTTDYIVDAVWDHTDINGWTRNVVNNKFAYWLKIQVASTTNSPTFSQISIRNMVASSEELVLPVGNAGNDSPSDVWKTRHETIEIIPGRNDKLNYNDGGNQTITLTPGVYRAAQLASHIETLLGAGYTVTYSSSTGYTFTKASGTFQLLCATGANKATSVLNGLGFDCSSNKTGALTYTTTYVRKSSGPTYTITSANKNFQFTDSGARNINLTEGVYSASSLQSMVKAAMDGSGGGFTDYDIQFDEEALVWSVKRAGGNISIQSSTFLTVISLGSAAAAAIHYGTDYRTGTGEWIVMIRHFIHPLSNINGIHDWVALNCNMTTVATAGVQEYAGAGSWDTQLNFTGGDLDSDNFYEILYLNTAAANTLRPLWKINIEDINNSQGYLQIGFLGGFAFGGDEYFELSRNIKENPSEGSTLYQDQSVGSSGVIHSAVVTRQPVFNYEIYAINATDKSNLIKMEKVIGTGTPFLFIPDHDLGDALIIRQMIWGTLATTFTFKEIDKAGLLFDANLSIITFI